MRLVILILSLLIGLAPRPGLAQPALSLRDVLRLAAAQRDEVHAVRAALRAAEQRPVIVSALDDPMAAISFDHVPYMGGGVDLNVTIEQRIPLSSVRAERRAAAQADMSRVRAEVGRSTLDVQLEAAAAFAMLYERRRMREVVDVQIAVARQVIAAANARYASGTAPQSDVLRAEVELARLESVGAGLAGEVRAAEAMLNAGIGRDAAMPVPALQLDAWLPLPEHGTAVSTALANRPELAAARAVVERSTADVQVMRSMSKPMLSLRTGPAYTMAAGHGWMAMAGVSVPLWQGKQRAAVAEASAMRDMADADVRAMARMIEGETAAAAAAATAAATRADAYRREVLPRARMAVESAASAYAAARVPLVSVIDTVQTQWSLELELVELESEEVLARARLARAMGSYEGILQ